MTCHVLSLVKVAFYSEYPSPSRAVGKDKGAPSTLCCNLQRVWLTGWDAC